jgi:hypothetical protein
MKISTLISSASMVAGGLWLAIRHRCFLQALAPTSLRKDCAMAMKLAFVPIAIISLFAVLLLPRIAAAEVNLYCPAFISTEIVGHLSVTATKVDGSSIEKIEGVPYAACIPLQWDGRRAFYYSHGTDADTTLEGIQGQLTLPDGTRLQDLFVQLGIAFAWLARSDPGLSDINVAVAELLALQETLSAELESSYNVTPAYNYISGVSQGAAIATTVIEREPKSFSGAIAVCGPIGSFWHQLFRSVDIYNLLDHYLSDPILQRANLSDAERLLEKDSSRSPVIPASVVAGVDALEDAIEELFSAPMANERLSIERFLRVTRLASLAFYEANPDLVASEIAGMMSEVVRNFDDGVTTLGGQVYNNLHRIYFGSGQDFLLNLRIQRFDPDTSMARGVVENFFETSGELFDPLVAPHNLPDPRVPFLHELLYELKAASMGAAALHTTVPLLRYGHCNIELPEALAALAILILQVEGLDLLGSDALLSDSRSRSIFDSLLDEAR